MEIFEWKDRVGYNVLYGRIVWRSVILAELHHVNASCKFRAKSQEQLVDILNFGLNESRKNIPEGLRTVLACIHNLYL
jgi:hypothetical protein